MTKDNTGLTITFYILIAILIFLILHMTGLIDLSFIFNWINQGQNSFQIIY